jgi:hypothetical protein
MTSSTLGLAYRFGKISKTIYLSFLIFKMETMARFWWLTPIILSTWEAEIRRITV